jgi:UDP-glucose 4-epimerase
MPIHPTDFYTEVRYFMERIAEVYHDFYDVKSIGLRAFSVYGPREDFKKTYANLITQLIWAKRDNTKFQIYGDGQQSRDFTYVADVASAYIKAMDSPIGLGVYNVGSGIAYSMREIIGKLKMEDLIDYVPNPLTNYVQDTLADVALARRDLGFQAMIGLDEGLDRMQQIYGAK